MVVALDRVYCCQNSVLMSQIDDEVVLMSIEKGYYFNLDEVGSSIWNRLKDNPQSISQICSGLMKEYEVDEQTCFQETTDFFEELLQFNLINEYVPA